MNNFLNASMKAGLVPISFAIPHGCTAGFEAVPINRQEGWFWGSLRLFRLSGSASSSVNQQCPGRGITSIVMKQNGFMADRGLSPQKIQGQHGLSSVARHKAKPEFESSRDAQAKNSETIAQETKQPYSIPDLGIVSLHILEAPCEAS